MSTMDTSMPMGMMPSTSPPLGRLAKLRSSISVYMHMYTICALFSSIGGFLLGFDTGSIGPVTTMLQFKEQYSPISPTLQGIIVSSILLTAAAASLPAGPLSDRISRKYTMSIGAGIFAVGSAIQVSASSLPQLLTGRLIAGVGEGTFLSVITVYQCEISPTAIRGFLVCFVQLFITIGIAAGYFVCYGTANLTGSMSWRLPFILQMIAATVFAIGSPFLIHSPRWLRQMGRHEDALRAWERLGLNPAKAEKEDSIAANEERKQEGHRDLKTELRQLWRKGYRERTFLGCFLMGMLQLSGVDAVLYYAPVLFTQAGLSSSKAAFLASGVSGLLNVVCTMIIQPFQDRWGRRSMIITGGSAIAGCMLLIGSIYASKAHLSPVGRWAIVALIYLFIIAFSMSWAIAIRVCASEIQPMRTRAAATSLGQATNGIVNWVVAFTTPRFLSRSTSGPYFLFGACSALTALVCLAFVPESNGVSLERLDEVFKTSPWRDMVARLRLGSWSPPNHQGPPLLKLTSELGGDVSGSRTSASDDMEMKIVSA